MAGRSDLFFRALPACLFWPLLMAWARGAFTSRGENYWPLIALFGMLMISSIWAIVFLAAAVVAKLKHQPTFEWWMPGLINLSPAALVIASYIFPQM